MSELNGKYKAKAIKFETTTRDDLPFIRCLFKLTHQWVDEDWDAINEDNNPDVLCSYTYWLNKEAKYKDSKMSPREFSELIFEKSWGFPLDKYKNLDDLNKAIVDQEKVLILKATEDKYHEIEYINALGGKKREGMKSLSSILG